jgi:hypothetical protein
MSVVDKKQIRKVADACEKVGDSCLENYEKTKKLEYAKVGISAFRNTLYANSLLIKSEKTI